MKVEIYVLPECDYCEYAMEWFDRNGIKYEEIVVAYNKKEQFKKIITERGKRRVTSFPQIFIDNVCIGGHSDLMLRKQEILNQLKEESNGNKNLLKNGLRFL